MPEILDQSDLAHAQSLLDSSGPAAMYDYLTALGYRYAELANGVAS
ncbi:MULTISPECIES: hypothetical protein [Pseudomonadaceae]|nr:MULTISPECIES: hypothetical protein [Pseudomonas]